MRTGSREISAKQGKAQAPSASLLECYQLQHLRRMKKAMAIGSVH